MTNDRVRDGDAARTEGNGLGAITGMVVRVGGSSLAVLVALPCGSDDWNPAETIYDVAFRGFDEHFAERAT